MVPSPVMFRAASSLIAVGILLVLANWYARPEEALAWSVALAVFAAMVAALRVSRRAVRRSMGEATVVRSLESVTRAALFAAIMMVLSLALSLARSYGLVDSGDVGQRLVGVLTSALLVMLGNAMPKNLPPLSSTPGDAARQQAFQRLAGWTWVLCGLASAVGWLALSIDTANIAMIALVVTAMAVSVGNLLRLVRRPRTDEPAPGLN